MNDVERVIYGLGDGYRVVAYWKIRGNDPSIDYLKGTANRLALAYPAITKIWAVDSDPVVWHGYQSARRGGLEDRVLFKVLLEEEGIQVF